MFGISLKHSLATVAVAAGVLASAGPASAAYQPAVAPTGFAIDVGTSEKVACDGIGAAYGPIR
jgi:hypothetical protein